MKYKIFLSLVVLVITMVQCTSSKTPQLSNRDPNGTSELQLTMREMYDHFDEIKSTLHEGGKIKNVEAFANLLTDVPTEEGKNETPIYKAMAESYLRTVETFRQDPTKDHYKQVVNTCMGCHQQVCPGPTVKIKKLYLE